MTAILMAGPALEPVSLAEAKAWFRVETSADDTLITGLITAARLTLEAATSTLFISQTWRVLLDRWPANGLVKIPLAPVRSLDVFRVFDAGGAGTAVPLASYQLDNTAQGARILFHEPPQQPGQKLAGIELVVTAGFGPAFADVPQPLRQAIKMLAARWYENRGDAVSDARRLPDDVSVLIAPFQRMRLA